MRTGIRAAGSLLVLLILSFTACGKPSYDDTPPTVARPEAVESPPPDATLRHPPGRVVQFPEDHSLGLLLIRPWGAGPEVRMTPLGEARGSVDVPPGVELGLHIGRVSPAMDFSALSRLRSDDLQSLAMNSEAITDEYLIHIAGLTALRSLSLSSRGITGEGFRHLSGMKSLETLILTNTSVTDTALSHLEALTSLRALYLNHSRVGDVGMRFVGRIASLEQLSLIGTRVGDAGLFQLRGLTSLKRLHLGQTDVTPAGVRLNQGLMPGCTITGIPPPRATPTPERRPIS